MTASETRPSALGQLKMIHGVLGAEVLMPVDVYDEAALLNKMRDLGSRGWVPGEIPSGGYTRPYAEADTFDFRLIGAKPFKMTKNGREVQCLKHRGLVYTRRAEEAVDKASKTMPAKIWYSRGAKAADGDTKDDNGAINYVTLIAFVGGGNVDPKYQRQQERAPQPQQQQQQRQEPAAPRPAATQYATRTPDRPNVRPEERVERVKAVLPVIYSTENLQQFPEMPPREHPFHHDVRMKVAHALKIDPVQISKWDDFSVIELETYAKLHVPPPQKESAPAPQPAPAAAQRAAGGISDLTRSNIINRLRDLRINVGNVKHVRSAIKQFIGDAKSLDELTSQDGVKLLDALIEHADAA